MSSRLGSERGRHGHEDENELLEVKFVSHG
jgi:hypothetical protein